MKSVLARICLGVAGYWAIAASVASAGYIDTLDTIAGANKVSYWNLQETEGAAADAWTTGTFDGTNDGTFSGSGYTRGAAGPRPDDGFLGFSPTNNAVTFSDDASQLLQMANSASFEGVQSLSLLLWFTSTGSGSDRVLGGLHDSNSGNSDRYGFLLNSRSSPLRAGARLWNGVSESGGLFTTANLGNRDGEWHFAVLTMEADADVPANKRVRIYFDGSEALSSTITGGGSLGLAPRHTSGADGVLAFGNDLGATSRALNGSLDEIAFIGRALTGGEVSELWNAALVPEPGSIIVFGIGSIIGLVAIERRRQMKR